MESMNFSRRNTSESKSEVSSRLPATVARYYQSAPVTHRATITEMRKRILKVVPKSVEVMSYGMPAFKVDETIVAGLRINRSSIGYYPFSGSVLKNFPKELQEFKITKASLQVPLGSPLKQSLVATLIKARISQCPVKPVQAKLSEYAKKDGYWRELEIAAPARRGLIDRKLFKITDLQKITALEFRAIHGIGANASRKIIAEMKKRKVSFKNLKKKS
jgi:uncharacterized protein YdhG (YjbR/CyaY superfamily)